MLPLAREFPDPLSAGHGEGHGGIALCLPSSWAYLPATGRCNCWTEAMGAFRQPPYSWPHCSEALIRLCTVVRMLTAPTASLFCCLLSKNINKLHVFTLLKGSTQGALCSDRACSSFGRMPKTGPKLNFSLTSASLVPSGNWTLISEA